MTRLLVPPDDQPLKVGLESALAESVRNLMNSAARNAEVSVQVELTFTDARGRVWAREQDGTLYGGESPATP